MENASSVPSFGFNLPPLGMDGENFDYRETSTRFFAGEKASKSFSSIFSIKFGCLLCSVDLFKHSTSMKENSCCGDDAGVQV